MGGRRVYYYSGFDEDVVKNRGQNSLGGDLVAGDFQAEDFKWQKKRSKLLYGLFFIVGWVYVRLVLRVKVVGREKLRDQEKLRSGNSGRGAGRGDGDCRGGGYFLIGNHTQELGDIFGPAVWCWPERPYYIASPANLGVPVVGRFLPNLGALVVPQNIHQMNNFRAAVREAGDKNPVVIYPEAHLWPYYTGVRPLALGGFQMAVEDGREIFIMTTTYQKRRQEKSQKSPMEQGSEQVNEQRSRRRDRRPKIVAYIDGPLKADPKLSKKQAARQLREEALAIMKKRSKLSTVEFVKYIKRK